MDPSRFDTLTRSLTTIRSRRGALATLLGGTLGLLGLADTAAKRKGKRKRKKKDRNPSPPPPAAGCPAGTVACEGACHQCCYNEDCCGGPCSVSRGQICRSQTPRLTCGCPDGRAICGGFCCASGESCINDGGGDICLTVLPSDRNLKANIAAVDPADMLGRVRALPIATWNYTFEDPAIRHIGPMAQDFGTAFGVGADDRHIHPIDGQGVALAAIQGLSAELEALREENARLAMRLRGLEAIPRVSEPASAVRGTE